MSHIQQVLALDLSGQPFAWPKPEDGVRATLLGTSVRPSRSYAVASRAGVQSEISVRPIIAIAGSDVMTQFLRGDLPLSPRDNELLFKRDRYTCAYRGVQNAHGAHALEPLRGKAARGRAREREG